MNTSTTPSNQNQSTNQELVLTRVFDAPRELVFRAWTDQAQMARWWSPAVFTTPVCELDPRPGGAIRIVMRDPDGVDYPMSGVFHEVVAPERLVFTTRAMEDEAGNAGLEFLNTITFADEADGKTRLTAHLVIVHAAPEASGALAGMEIGWNQQLDKLAAFVAAGNAAH